MSHYATELAVLGLVWGAVCTSSVTAREWTDSTGRYKTEAELIAYNESTVVLKKDEGQLVAVPIKQLSDEDQNFLKSKDAEQSVRSADQLQTWTMKDGMKVVGRVVGYGRRDVTIQRRRGKTYVNDRLLSNLPEVYQKMVPRIVEHLEGLTLTSDRQFEAWVNGLLGQARTYTLEGVRLELENGDEYAVPFFFFSDNDLELLKGGWDEWLAAEQDRQQQEQHNFYLESQARAYQQSQMAANQQIQMMQLELLAVNAGLVDLWEVALIPGPGQIGFTQTVIVPARNSLQATNMALQRNPGYVAGPVRKVAGR